MHRQTLGNGRRAAAILLRAISPLCFESQGLPERAAIAPRVALSKTVKVYFGDLKLLLRENSTPTQPGNCYDRSSPVALTPGPPIRGR